MIEHILLIRHGETSGNRDGVVQVPETPLNRHGRRQAHHLAVRLDRLRGARRLRLISSDYLRAAQTAEAIARRCGVSCEAEPLLRERNFGHLRGQRYDDLRRLQIDPFASGYRPLGGEDWTTFDRRVQAAWNAVIERADDDSEDPEPALLACVTHGFVLRRLIDLHLHLDGDGRKISTPERWGNTSVTCVAAQAPFPVTLLNCTEHLAEQTGAGDDQQAISGI